MKRFLRGKISYVVHEVVVQNVEAGQGAFVVAAPRVGVNLAAGVKARLPQPVPRVMHLASIPGKPIKNGQLRPARHPPVLGQGLPNIITEAPLLRYVVTREHGADSVKVLGISNLVIRVHEIIGGPERSRLDAASDATHGLGAAACNRFRRRIEGGARRGAGRVGAVTRDVVDFEAFCGEPWDFATRGRGERGPVRARDRVRLDEVDVLDDLRADGDDSYWRGTRVIRTCDQHKTYIFPNFY